jgi:hypothetical protein
MSLLIVEDDDDLERMVDEVLFSPEKVTYNNIQ